MGGFRPKKAVFNFSLVAMPWGRLVIDKLGHLGFPNRSHAGEPRGLRSKSFEKRLSSAPRALPPRKVGPLDLKFGDG
jgi:hypothetical protein